MSKSLTRAAFAFLAVAAITTGLRAQSPGGYLLPPKVIVDILDAAPTPAVIVGPNRQMVALLERRSMPGLPRWPSRSTGSRARASIPGRTGGSSAWATGSASP